MDHSSSNGSAEPRANGSLANGPLANGPLANGSHANGSHSSGLLAQGSLAQGSLALGDRLRGRNLIVVGGTGFLGKVWWSQLLRAFPEVGHIYLVVRPKAGRTVESRFWEQVVKSEVLTPLRDVHTDAFEAFIRSKVTPIAGDVSKPFCGIEAHVRDQVRGKIAAVVNVAGVVDFDPPLDEALEVNAFGCQNLVALARDIGDAAVLHTSTCYVAGGHTGPIPEQDPRIFPFPRADELDVKDWSPDREISECLDVIEQARHRASDAFRQSRFLDEAKKNLEERDEPARGAALEDEIRRVKRKFVEAQLADMGMERARFWGWPNTYTYTKSIGEQIVASSGLPYTIVRPAIVESTVSYPFPGWNEGINTSAPFIYMLREGGLQIPGDTNYLDVIPCDMVTTAITLALGELLEGTAKPVYQAGSTDTNPCTMARFFELTGLYKRVYYKRTGRGGPLLSALQSHFEGQLLNRANYDLMGPKQLAKGATALGQGLAALGAKPLAKGLFGFARTQQKLGRIMDVFIPFTAEYHYIFRTDNTRGAWARLSPEEQSKLCWAPESIDWREWFLEVHVPALERHVFPLMDERLRRPVKAPRRHQNLVELLEEMAARYDLKTALQRTEHDGLSRLSFREWRDQAAVVAGKLKAAGVQPGDRVLLAGANHPSWPVAFFGILYAGATTVPLDAAIEPATAKLLAEASRAKVFLGDEKVLDRMSGAVDLPLWDLRDALEPGTPVEPASVNDEDVAALIYTSGTTGSPKGVMLTHENLSSLVASLAPLFPLSDGDRVLSVLPLHHTFELTCGMLLPLSRGSRVIYLDELNAERLTHGLEAGRATALVGVPALWEMLERRIHARIAEKGAASAVAFDLLLELNRMLGKNLGLDLGRMLFGPVHQGLGGHLKFLVSGGAALNSSTHKLFQGLGLHLSEGYGLTEASPVLTVAKGGPRAKAGSVGQPIPGVEVRIHKPNEQGVGEVLARGPNVMLGYADHPEATAAAIDADGWLHTGDLGKLDHRGRLELVGRQKDVIVASNGENVYPDDVEERLGRIEHVAELSVVGIGDGRGGERVACVAVPEATAGESSSERRQKARSSLNKALGELPLSMKPAYVRVIDTPLPRTSTRKVKRAEVRTLLERLQQAEGTTNGAVATPATTGDNLTEIVRSAVAVIGRRKPSDVGMTQSLRGELGFDSLMALELLVAIEAKLGTTVDADRLSQSDTVSEIVEVLRTGSARRAVSSTKTIEKDDTPIELPEPLRLAAMHWMGTAQRSFYDRVMHTTVTGRAFIPHNQNTLVVANHSSHLDMGLVKYALGDYGRSLASLAAQDYFFEGNRWRKAYFEQLTNLVPMSRSGSLRGALRQAGELLEQGKTVLIFPEGTRGSGSLQPFKPAVGHLVLHHEIDVLPVWLGGTAQALPKGASVPRSRNLKARIGPPLSAKRLIELTQGMPSSEAARVVAKITEQAVAALSRGQVFTLDDVDPALFRKESAPPPDPAEALFGELGERFVAGSVEVPLTFYFSLGDDRYTMRVESAQVDIAKGKTVGQADCVLKTSFELFERIVREAYTPTPQEFMSGAIKSNNIAHLFTFQKVFQLQTPTTEWQKVAGLALDVPGSSGSNGSNGHHDSVDSVPAASGTRNVDEGQADPGAQEESA